MPGTVHYKRQNTDRQFIADDLQALFTGKTDGYYRFVQREQCADPERWARFAAQFRLRTDASDNGWRGEYWGKTMRGAAFVYSYTRDPALYRTLCETVRDVLDCADETGAIASYPASAAFAALTFALLLVLNATGRSFPRDILKLYLYCPFALSLVLAVSAIPAGWCRTARGLLARVGAISFEIYLLYEKVAQFSTWLFRTDDRMHLLYYIPVFVVTMLLAAALHRTCARIVRAFGQPDGGTVCS